MLLSGSLRDLLDVPVLRRGERRGRAGGRPVRGRAGGACRRVARHRGRPDGRADHRARPVPVGRAAPAAGAGAVADHRPRGAGARRADVRRRLAHRGPDRGRGTAAARRAARPSCSPPHRCSWTMRTGWCSSTRARSPRSVSHRELLHNEPRYRAVVTRETEDESGRRPQLDDLGWTDGRPRLEATRGNRGDGMIGVAPPAYDPAAPTTATHPAGRRLLDRTRLRGRTVSQAPPRLPAPGRGQHGRGGRLHGRPVPAGRRRPAGLGRAPATLHLELTVGAVRARAGRPGHVRTARCGCAARCSASGCWPTCARTSSSGRSGCRRASWSGPARATCSPASRPTSTGSPTRCARPCRSSPSAWCGRRCCSAGSSSPHRRWPRRCCSRCRCW